MNNETPTDVSDAADPLKSSLSTLKGNLAVLDKPIRAYKAAVDAQAKIPQLAKEIEGVSGMRVEAAIRVHDALSLVDVPIAPRNDSGDGETLEGSSPVRDRIVAYFASHAFPGGIRMGDVARGTGMGRGSVFQCVTRNKAMFKSVGRGLYVMEVQGEQVTRRGARGVG